MKERRKREQEREDKEAIRSKLQKLAEPGDRVKDFMVEGGYGGAENGKNKAVESDEENFNMASAIKQSTWATLQLLEHKPSFVTTCCALNNIGLLKKLRYLQQNIFEVMTRK